MSTPDRPLVTFALFAYNQERFIRQAVEGAFSQTYSPLEIILSDDCSTDHTFEILSTMVSTYSGPHSIRMNQTQHNGGLAAHINEVMALAKGELVVVAAGDDISVPGRVEMLMEEWQRNGRPSGMASGTLNIDVSGDVIGQSHWRGKQQFLKAASRTELLHGFVRQEIDCVLPGCSAAWSRTAWEEFGSLANGVVSEDDVLTFRSLLLRGIVLIDAPLVKYRQHSGSIANRPGPKEQNVQSYLAYEKHKSEWAGMEASTFRGILADLDTACQKRLIDDETAKKLFQGIKATIVGLELRSHWWGLPFHQRIVHYTQCPDRRFPLNFTSFLSLETHSKIHTRLARFKRKLSRQRVKKC